MRVAEVAELVDALGSGSSWGFPVKVRVFSSAPIIKIKGCNRIIIAALFSFHLTIISRPPPRLTPLNRPNRLAAVYHDSGRDAINLSQL